jgi:ring-1,2-phenylacetyl-CoA epoxidase subunit PaaC
MSKKNQHEHMFEYCLRIGDTSLILGQRLSEWCGHGPILEEDIAMTNLALDCIGQTQIILDYAGKMEGKNRSADDLANYRDVWQYRNLLIVEQPNGDFAMTMMRQYLVSTFNFLLYSKLKNSKDETLAAFGEKSVKEVAYHVRHSSDWLVRLGDGTPESHNRMQAALNELWFFVDDMFAGDETDQYMADNEFCPDINSLKAEWNKMVIPKFKEAGLVIPEVNNQMRTGSRLGNHTEHLGYILAEMQFLPRAYPDAKW